MSCSASLKRTGLGPPWITSLMHHDQAIKHLLARQFGGQNALSWVGTHLVQFW
jgi:hypothetical protein